MSRTAQVNSIDAIDQFRAALGVFGEEAGQVLAEIRTELQRFQNWLEHDQLTHWQRQIRLREERVVEAKLELSRCRSATIDPNRTPSCLQEKKLLGIAKQRLEEAERKLAAVRHWIVVVRQAVIDYHGRVEPLASATAADIPKGMAELSRAVARLHAYLDLAPGASEPAQAASNTFSATSSEPAAAEASPPSATRNETADDEAQASIPAAVAAQPPPPASSRDSEPT